jgi:hypothetical protein
MVSYEQTKSRSEKTLIATFHARAPVHRPIFPQFSSSAIVNFPISGSDSGLVQGDLTRLLASNCG